MSVNEIFQKLYASEITDEEAKSLMDGDSAKEELLELFNKRVLPLGYFGIKE